MPDTTLRSFTAHDGSNLAVMDWPLPSGTPTRGLVVIVHGLGEHAGRYDHVAEHLNSWGPCRATAFCWTTWPNCSIPHADAWTRACR